MNKMSLEKGRVNQKLKTRSALLQSAKKLMARQKRVTLEHVADEASVSRATIYRYFPNVELLLTEASLEIHHLTPDELIEEMGSLPILERISFIQRYYNQLAQDHEILFRRYLSAVLAASSSTKKKVRGARRKEALIKAITPLDSQLTGEDRMNLVNIASILMGIDAFITAKDVCGLNSEEATATLEWGLNMIVKGMINDLK
jgi:AcrR family transcriptional regulator